MQGSTLSLTLPSPSDGAWLAARWRTNEQRGASVAIAYRSCHDVFLSADLRTCSPLLQTVQPIKQSLDPCFPQQSV